MGRVSRLNLNSILTAYFLVLASLLLTKYMHQPLRYLPAMLFVPVLAMPTQIKAYHYIVVIRALVVTAVFYAIARRLAIVALSRDCGACYATDARNPVTIAAASMTAQP